MWSHNNSLKSLFTDRTDNEMQLKSQPVSPLLKEEEPPRTSNNTIARSFDAHVRQYSSNGFRESRRPIIEDNEPNSSSKWIDALAACTVTELEQFDVEREGVRVEASKPVDVHHVFGEVCQVLQLERQHEIKITKMRELYESREMLLEDQCQRLCDRLHAAESKLLSDDLMKNRWTQEKFDGAVKLEQHRRTSSEQLLSKEVKLRQACEKEIDELIAAQRNEKVAFEKEREEAEAREQILQESVQQLEAKLKAKEHSKDVEVSSVTPKSKEIDIEAQNECQVLRDQMEEDRVEHEDKYRRLQDFLKQREAEFESKIAELNDQSQKRETVLKSECESLRLQVERVKLQLSCNRESELESECDQLRDRVEEIQSKWAEEVHLHGELQAALDLERKRHAKTTRSLSQEYNLRESIERKLKEATNAKANNKTNVSSGILSKYEEERKRLAEDVARLKVQLGEQSELRKRAEETIGSLQNKINESESSTPVLLRQQQEKLPENTLDPYKRSISEEDDKPRRPPATHFTQELLAKNWRKQSDSLGSTNSAESFQTPPRQEKLSENDAEFKKRTMSEDDGLPPRAPPAHFLEELLIKREGKQDDSPAFVRSAESDPVPPQRQEKLSEKGLDLKRRTMNEDNNSPASLRSAESRPALSRQDKVMEKSTDQKKRIMSEDDGMPPRAVAHFTQELLVKSERKHDGSPVSVRSTDSSPTPRKEKFLERALDKQRRTVNEDVAFPLRPAGRFIQEKPLAKNERKHDGSPASVRSVDSSPASNRSARDSYSPKVQDQSPARTRAPSPAQSRVAALRTRAREASPARASEMVTAREAPSGAHTRVDRMKTDVIRRTRTRSADGRQVPSARGSTYVVSKTGLTRHRMLYHVQGCRQVVDEDGNDKEYPMTVEEIKYMRHRPCPICKPKTIGVLQNRLLL